MWGIQRRDRRWFQLMTLIGGTAGAVGLTLLELVHGRDSVNPNLMMRNIVLGIGASFIAAGFISWGLLHIKEMIMAIADWIREATERRRQRIREQARREGLQEGREAGLQAGLQEGRQEGRQEGYAEGYVQGYDDAEQGKPRSPGR